jgi:hypothetical protein
MHEINRYIYIYVYIFLYGSTEHSKGNKTVPGKVATTRTEDGHRVE